LNSPNHPDRDIGGDRQFVAGCTLEFRAYLVQYGCDRPGSEDRDRRGTFHNGLSKHDRRPERRHRTYEQIHSTRFMGKG
jgi:hypothetical protein